MRSDFKVIGSNSGLVLQQRNPEEGKGKYIMAMEVRVFPRSPMRTTVPANWYCGHRTKSIGDYFGSVTSILPDETYVTQDGAYIVNRNRHSKTFAVSRNACAHAGARLLQETGPQSLTHEIRCPVHRWGYKPSGECTSAPHFDDCDQVRLARATFGTWNGYVIGYEQKLLDAALARFGEVAGVDADAFNPANFVFVSEEYDELPYPRELMMINYMDGYHVAPFHPKSFGVVADPTTYKWELSEYTDRNPVWYSIQRVREHPDVRRRMHGIMEREGLSEEDLGWGHLYTWVRDVLVEQHGVEFPIDEKTFALWAAVYGNGYLMPELYIGGLFLAVSYLVNIDPDNPETGNRNYVEYYVHKRVPEELRKPAAALFKRAYDQSAREDDEICAKHLWPAHKRGDLEFNRAWHTVMELGDDHWREWYKRHYMKR